MRFVFSPLHGVPIMWKDNIVTHDLMEGTSGSHVLLGSKPGHEATVATKLRDAGAVLLGKTNQSEWANARWRNASTGWSPRDGQCTGAFYPYMKASRSSTGSAVATCLGPTFASLGTEVCDSRSFGRDVKPRALTLSRRAAASSPPPTRQVWLA